jgi:hypothetical protein
MKSPLKIALLAAVPIEFVNFCLLSWNVGEPLPRHLIHRILAEQWVAFHWLGILSLNALYRMGSSAVWEILAVVLCGYLETAFGVGIVLFALRGLRHRHRTHPAMHS